MTATWTIAVAVALTVLLAALALKVVKQYEQGVLFRLGRVIAVRNAGLTAIIPFIDVLHRVSLRIVMMPIPSQGIITSDNVSVDVSAVAYYRVTDAVKSVVAIENVQAAINQIAQTTLRKVVGQHTLDETLSETDRINLSIREILDVATEEWGVAVTLVELKDIQLSDSLVDLGVDQNTTVVFPAPLMSTIGEQGSFLAREAGAVAVVASPPKPAKSVNGPVPAQPLPGSTP
jgi:regulator of protease activity HflC (stomatin/prohibitin superfamily)